MTDLPAPRAPYFDQFVLNAIAAGVPQIVNLVAGYDDRALRFAVRGGSVAIRRCVMIGGKKTNCVLR
ncbi:class I SAM-dependent methyltransferase [Caballeronia sordidicola]|uniref:class I SAM-dependent methyltransferase n=1 Tax=Caballeronia sordidicola TaxID=196367 RepID=UPI00355816DB